MIKRVLIFLVVVVTLGFLVFLNKKKSSSALSVSATVVKRRSISEWVEGDGETRPAKLVNVGSDVTAKIIRILHREGDKVHKGDILCLLDDSTYRAKVKETQAKLERDFFTYKSKEKEFERARRLYERGFISKKALEDAELAFNTYRAILKQDSSLLEQAQRTLNKTIIRATVSGVVLAVYKEEGEMAIVGTINTPGSVIMTIAEMDSMEIKGYVDETGILKVKRGQPVKIRLDAFPGKSFKGIVYRVMGMPENSSQNNVVTYPVYIRIIDSIRLYPGMSASIKILVKKAENVPVVPLEAIGRDKQGYYVWQVKGRRCIKKRIVKGVESFEYAEIKHGIWPEDTVIIGPLSVLRKLNDSTLIKVRIIEKKGSFTGRKWHKN